MEFNTLHLQRPVDKRNQTFGRGCFFLVMTLLFSALWPTHRVEGWAVDSVQPDVGQFVGERSIQDKEPAGQKKEASKQDSSTDRKKEEQEQEDEKDGKSESTKSENGENGKPASDGSEGGGSENADDSLEGTTETEKTPRDTTPLPIDWSVEGTKDLNFDHLKFNIQPDETFQIRQLTAQLIKLRGHKIRIRGYIKPAFKSTDIQKFVLVRDNQECCFGPGAALYDCMIVNLKTGHTTDYSTRPITVEGTFQLKPFRGEDKRIWAIFSLKDAQVQ